jgi:hypothetical protein
MSIKSMIVAAVIAFAGTQGASFAEDAPKPEAGKEQTKAEGHCEKTQDGKSIDVDAKDKAECKKLGGKWQKGAKHDDHK